MHKGDKIIGFVDMAVVIGGGILEHIYLDSKNHPWIIYTADKYNRKVGVYDGMCYTSEENYNKQDFK